MGLPPSSLAVVFLYRTVPGGFLSTRPALDLRCSTKDAGCSARHIALLRNEISSTPMDCMRWLIIFLICCVVEPWSHEDSRANGIFYESSVTQQECAEKKYHF